MTARRASVGHEGTSGAALDCWLVGRGALLVACGELLLSRGHRVTGVAGEPGPARQWAAGLGIPVADRVRDLGGPRPRYLLSIANPDVLAPRELDVCSGLAVNFHSSPLPRYAGVHHLPWAIVNGEQEFGVTWHVMHERLDSGGILVQRRFALDAGETALTLGIKCYDHGLAAFVALVEQLEAGAPRPLAQDLSQRTYYPRRLRLPDAGLVSSARTAEEIERWCRGADQGPAVNDFGVPKVVLPGAEAVVLREVSVRAPTAADRGGLVVPSPSGTVALTTPGGDLVVHRVRLPDGSLTHGSDWAAAAGLTPGSDAALPAAADAARAGILDAAFGSHENAWRRALAAVQPDCGPALPGSGARPADRPSGAATSVLPVPPAVRARLTSRDSRRDLLAGLAAAWVAYAAGFGRPRQTFWWSEPTVREAVGGLDALFATAVPVTAAAHEDVVAAVARAVKRGTYQRDVEARSPDPAQRGAVADIAFALDTGPVRLRPEPLVTVCLATPGDRLHIMAPDSGTSFTVAAVLAVGLGAGTPPSR